MRKNNTLRRAAALMAALSITVSLAAPAFADTYYIDYGDITVTKNADGSQTIQQGTESWKDAAGEETVITTSNTRISTLESDLEGPAAEDSGFGPVVEDNYQPAAPAQPEDADQPENADQQKDADQRESADQQAQPQQAAPAASTPVNKKENGFWGNTITVFNNYADTVLNLTLKNVKIDASDRGLKAALSVQGDGNVTIELDGKNELKSGLRMAGLEKNTSEGTLTLKDDKEPGSGSLKAEGGELAAGIGGSANSGTNNITITGGTVNAIGGEQGAGIGGGGDVYGNGSHITITGGTVNAKGGYNGAGIGGGDGGNGDHIAITGGTVNATGGDSGAGIGGGSFGQGNDITITGGAVTAEAGISGAGIGGGYYSNGSGNITVSGAAQVTAVAGKSEGIFVGAGATIGDGGKYSHTGDDVDGKEIQADISGLTTGHIRHLSYNKEDDSYWEWWEYGHPQTAPAEDSSDTPLLHVEPLEGVLLPFNARQQGRTLTVTSDTLAARLHGTREALEALQEQGVEQIQFVTTLKTTTLSVEDLLAEGGSRFALEHNGPVSRLLSAAQAESLKCQALH